MSEVTTMILPSWVVIIFIALIAIGASFGLGALVKYLLRSKWFTVISLFKTGAIDTTRLPKK